MGTKMKAVTAEAKAGPISETRRVKPRAPRSAVRAEKLVCRYCGSDDLAPSFRKRRDARCRACFKKRYGSGARGRKRSSGRKANARK